LCLPPSRRANSPLVAPTRQRPPTPSPHRAFVLPQRFLVSLTNMWRMARIFWPQTPSRGFSLLFWAPLPRIAQLYLCRVHMVGSQLSRGAPGQLYAISFPSPLLAAPLFCPYFFQNGCVRTLIWDRYKGFESPLRWFPLIFSCGFLLKLSPPLLTLSRKFVEQSFSAGWFKLFQPDSPPLLFSRSL